MNGYKLLKSDTVLRYWPVYDGNSMMIDNNGNQSMIQDWENLQGFGYDIFDDKIQDYKSKFVSKDDLTEYQYNSLMTDYDPER